MPEDGKQTYGLVHSFLIDNGELDGVSPQQIFVLGVEWQTIFGNMKTGKTFSVPLRRENEDRVRALLNAEGRTYKISDNGEWLWLEVYGVMPS